MEKARFTVQQYDELCEQLLERPYHVIDFLPEQVPADCGGQYFAAERFYMEHPETLGLYAKFANLLIQLNCYCELAITEGEGGICDQVTTEEGCFCNQAVIEGEDRIYASALTEGEDRICASALTEGEDHICASALTEGEGGICDKGAAEEDGNCTPSFTEESLWSCSMLPEELWARVLKREKDGTGFLNILIPEEKSLITLNGGDLYMTLYAPTERVLRIVTQLAAAQGLFVRKGEC